MPGPSAQKQLAGIIAKFDPPMQRLIRAAPSSSSRGRGSRTRRDRFAPAEPSRGPGLIEAAVSRAKVPRDGKHPLLIKAVSAKQRPRLVRAGDELRRSAGRPDLAAGRGARRDES